MTIHLEQPLSRYTVTADNRYGDSVARPPVVPVVSVDELIIFVFRRQQRQQKQQQLFYYNSNLPLSQLYVTS